MKVSEIIAELARRYDPEDELIIAWWDSSLFERYDPDEDEFHPIDRATWMRIGAKAEKDLAETIGETVFHYVQSIVDEETEVKETTVEDDSRHE